MKEIYKGRVVGINVTGNEYLANALEVELSDGRHGTIPVDMIGFKLPNQVTGRRMAKRFLGRTVIVKIVQEDPLILSNQAAVIEQRKAIHLQEGQVIEGIIVGIGTREVKIEYAYCMILVLSDSEYNVAKKTSFHFAGLSFGEKIQVQVISIDDGNVTVSRKPLIKQSWINTASQYQEKGQYLGKVLNFIREGVFVQLEPGLDILCSPYPFFKIEPGDEVTVEIRKVNIETGRIKGMITGRAVSA